MFGRILIILLLSSCFTTRRPTLVQMLKAKRLVDKARIEMSVGDLQHADELISFAKEISPKDPVVLDAFGCLCWHRKKMDLAESYFRDAIMADPNFENSYINLAIILEEKGEIQKAKDLLQKALSINPLNHKARNNYAGIVFDYALTARERNLARIELNKAVNSAPELDSVLKYNIDKFNRARARLN